MGDDTQGTLTSSFVYGGNSYYYLDEDGVAQCGLKTDGYRAYIECMKEWYDKGWTDPYFEEHTSDIMFWKVDTEKVYSGKVGLLYSGVGSLGNRTATEDQPDLCLYGASYPINDIYGDEDCKNNEPTCFFGNGVISNSVIITEKINKEYLPAFLTALDYLYGEEGATLRAFGFSDEEQAELQDDFYNEWGLEDGAYTVEERDGEKIYVINQAVYADDNLQNAAKLTRVVGAGINGPVDFGYDETYAAAINLYKVYLNSGNIDSVITGQMTAEQQDETSANTANIRTYVSMEVPNFITGRTDISSDSDWQAFCDGIDNYNPMVYVDYVNEVLGN